MIYNNLNRTGQIEEIKTKNDKEIVEVYGGIGENNPIYYKKTAMEGVAPLSFKALGQPLTNYTIYGAGGVGDRTSNVMPSAAKQTITFANDQLTLTCDGEGRYTITGTNPSSSNFAVVEIPLLQSFIIPHAAAYSGGNGTFSLWNNTASQSSIAFMYNTTTIDSWQCAPINRKEDTYLAIGGKTCNRIRINIAPNFSGTFTISPHFTDNGQYPVQYEPGIYKIPIVCGGTTTNIYRNKPICNESLSYSETEVQIPTAVGQNTLSIGTTVQPNQVTIEHKEPAKIMQGVAPLTFTSDGSPLENYTIHGATGGVGDKTDNEYNLYSLPNTYYHNGVTFTVDTKAGTITANGKATNGNAYLSFGLPENLYGNMYFMGCPVGGDSGGYDIYTWDDTVRARPKTHNGVTTADNDRGSQRYLPVQFVQGHRNSMTVRVWNGFTANNIVFKPILSFNQPAVIEPYGYKIPITCGGVTTNIYLDSPLYEGDSISLSTAEVEILTIEGENTLTVGTTVQPSNIEISYKEPAKTLTGSLPLNFMSDGSLLIDYVIYDNSVGVGDKTKNLANVDEMLQGYYAFANGNFTASNYWICTPKIACSEDTYYTFSFKNVSRYYGIVWWKENGQYISSNSLARNTGNVVFTAKAPANAALMSVQVGSASSPTNPIAKADMIEFQLEEGSIATSYEPYGYKIPISCGGGTTNIYLDAPLYLYDSITFSTAQTTIPTIVGQNTLSVGTTVQPSKVLIEGNIKT